jgi:hypothetical protein
MVLTFLSLAVLTISTVNQHNNIKDLFADRQKVGETSSAFATFGGCALWRDEYSDTLIFVVDGVVVIVPLQITILAVAQSPCRA